MEKYVATEYREDGKAYSVHVGAASSGDAARICAERGYTLEGRLGAEVYDGSLAATLAEGLAGKAVAV